MPTGRTSAGFVRSAAEAAVLLAIGVATFREFAAEGYMISTGSMAPTLRGYHRPAECDACGHAFAAGAAAELGLSQTAAASADPSGPAACRCPACGSEVEPDGPITEGDQLLVHRGAFALRDPRRWEVVVFRDWADLSQAFVKRVAGKPGETVEVRRGDVLRDGVLLRKPLSAQTAVAIPVADATKGGRCWDADEGVTGEGTGFAFPASEDWRWVRYRHRVEAGGEHRTSLAVEGPPDVDVRTLSGGRVAYRSAGRGGELVARGAVDAATLSRLLDAGDDPATADALTRLAEESRFAPVTDACGYNAAAADAPQFVVRDLMWRGSVTLSPGSVFRVRLLYGRQPFELVLDADRRRAVLVTPRADGTSGVLREATLPAGELDLTLSTFDRQVLAAVGDRLLFEPLPFGETPLSGLRTRTPLRMAARGGAVSVRDVRLDRDVYYTPKGEGGRRTLAADEFFVLGDNSPVSVDSRVWPGGSVRRSDLLGKPFVVHLPSKRVAGWGDSVRVPDWGRVRLVR